MLVMVVIAMTLMNAWHVEDPGPIESRPLRQAAREVPQPGKGELLIHVHTCGVCRTDLHVTEGDLPVHKHHVTPGHEVVGVVEASGEGVEGFSRGERVGVAWLRHTCGQCKYCARGDENLCPYSLYTGWDANGGYAEYVVAPADYVYRLPEGYDDEHLAPMLCAGIIGYRALKRAGLPTGSADGWRLGLYGFGGSAHLAAQVALASGARVHVMTREAESRELALSLGAASAQGAYAEAPEPLDAAILFAPVGDLVPVCLRALDRGGVLATAGIYLSDVPQLNYEHELFYEKEIRSVTSNTREDGREFLQFAATHPLHITTHPYAADRASQALRDLKAGAFAGAAVLKF